MQIYFGKDAMNFLNFLKTIGHDLSTVGKDIEAGLELATPILELVPGIGPTLATIIADVEEIVNGLTAAGATIGTKQVSQITQTSAQMAGLKAAAKVAQ